MTQKNLQILLKSRPEGLPSEENFEIVENKTPALEDGQILVQNLYVSLDPAMRGWMKEGKSYVPPVKLGAVMRAFTVGEVVESRHDDFAAGDRVAGTLGWQRFAVTKPAEVHRVPREVPPELALGPLGPTGMTAYFGLLDIGRPRKGETVLVSAAAGATGSVVGQLARLHGCRAVGIAGGAEKCRWIQSDLGFDAAVDYKSSGDLDADLRQACPDGVDVYFDNVGGDILDAALKIINRGARVVLCGAISQYNQEKVQGPSNYLSLLVQRARLEGFIVLDYVERFPEAQAALGRWLAEGKIAWRPDIVEGLENAPKALLKLFDGSNKGKLMVKVD